MFFQGKNKLYKVTRPALLGAERFAERASETRSGGSGTAKVARRARLVKALKDNTDWFPGGLGVPTQLLL